MAVIRFSEAINDARGSAGGTVFSRNRFGAYMRARTAPINPNSPSQISSRQLLNTMATYWRDTLSQANRDGWDLYAENTDWLNKIGQTVNLTGLNHYCRANRIRLAAGESAVHTYPTAYGLPNQEELWTLAVDSTTGLATITFTFAADVDDQVYQFFAGKPVSGSRNYFGGPWRYMDSVIGDSTTPPTSPITPTYPYPLVAGAKAFVYCVRVDADNRASLPFRQSAIVT